MHCPYYNQRDQNLVKTIRQAGWLGCLAGDFLFVLTPLWLFCLCLCIAISWITGCHAFWFLSYLIHPHKCWRLTRLCISPDSALRCLHSVLKLHSEGIFGSNCTTSSLFKWDWKTLIGKRNEGTELFALHRYKISKVAPRTYWIFKEHLVTMLLHTLSESHIVQ